MRIINFIAFVLCAYQGLLFVGLSVQDQSLFNILGAMWGIGFAALNLKIAFKESPPPQCQ